MERNTIMPILERVLAESGKRRAHERWSEHHTLRSSGEGSLAFVGLSSRPPREMPLGHMRPDASRAHNLTRTDIRVMFWGGSAGGDCSKRHASLRS